MSESVAEQPPIDPAVGTPWDRANAEAVEPEVAAEPATPTDQADPVEPAKTPEEMAAGTPWDPARAEPGQQLIDEQVAATESAADAELSPQQHAAGTAWDPAVQAENEAKLAALRAAGEDPTV